jgi:hypothetical protein
VKLTIGLATGSGQAVVADHVGTHRWMVVHMRELEVVDRSLGLVHKAIGQVGMATDLEHHMVVAPGRIAEQVELVRSRERLAEEIARKAVGEDIGCMDRSL